MHLQYMSIYIILYLYIKLHVCESVSQSPIVCPPTHGPGAHSRHAGHGSQSRHLGKGRAETKICLIFFEWNFLDNNFFDWKKMSTKLFLLTDIFVVDRIFVFDKFLFLTQKFLPTETKAWVLEYDHSITQIIYSREINTPPPEHR